MHSQTEETWIAYWNELYDLIKSIPSPTIFNQKDEILSLEQAQALIQDEVYKGNKIEFILSEYNEQPAIRIVVI